MVVALPKVKEDFANIVESITLQPWTLLQFIVWLDLKLAEYKINGYMVLDQSFGDIPDWLANITLEAPDDEKELNERGHDLMSQLSRSMSLAQDDDSNDIKILPITSDALSPPRGPPSPVREAPLSGYRRNYKPQSVDYAKIQRKSYTSSDSRVDRTFDSNVGRLSAKRQAAPQASFSPVISQVISEAKYRRVATASQSAATTPAKSAAEPIMITDDDIGLSHDTRRTSLESSNRDRIPDDTEGCSAQDRLTFSEPRHRAGNQRTQNGSNIRDLNQRIHGDSNVPNTEYVSRTMGSNLSREKRAVSSTTASSPSDPSVPPYLDINTLNVDSMKEQSLNDFQLQSSASQRAMPRTGMSPTDDADPVPTQMFANTLRGHPSTSTGQTFSQEESSFDETSTANQPSSRLSTDIDGEIAIKSEPDTDTSMTYPSTSHLRAVREGVISHDGRSVSSLQESSHPIGIVRCVRCRKTFPNRFLLGQHTLHCRGYAVKCVDCGKQYRSESGLNNHRLTIHATQQRYTCGKCGKKFHSKIHFEGHMNVHYQLQPYKCKRCGMGFSYKFHLSSHEKWRCKC